MAAVLAEARDVLTTVVVLLTESWERERWQLIGVESKRIAGLRALDRINDRTGF